jgi:integrase
VQLHRVPTFNVGTDGDRSVSRSIHRLSPAKVKNARPGKRPDGTPRVQLYADGGGLYLQVTPGNNHHISKSWIFRFAGGNGKERYMGLGSFDTVGLDEAREKAGECRKLRDQGKDPIETRTAQRASAAAERAKAMTFEQCAERYIAAHRAGWRNPKHASQWQNTLATYVSPTLGRLPVQAVDVGLVTKVLEPIWSTKPETASRVRGRIEAVLDWAAARGFREADNPARWKGRLDKLLPRRSKVRAVQHHAALPYPEIGAFICALRERPATAARALEFAILTAARTGEVLGARWSEIDLRAKVWTVPASRMKSGREHRVPLSDAAIAVLQEMHGLRENDHVFPGDRREALSDMALLMLLRRMNRSDLTAHGFRSTFRDWAAECTNFPNEVVEMALAHAVSDKVEAAYRRGDLFEKRRKVMDAWASYCARSEAPGKLVALGR